MKTVNKKGWLIRYGYFGVSNGNFFSSAPDVAQAINEFRAFAITLPAPSTTPKNAPEILFRSMEPFSFSENQEGEK